MAVNVWWLCWRQWLMQWWIFLVYLFVVLPCNCGQTVPVDSTEESILLCKSRNPKKLVLKPPLSSVQYAFFRKLVLKCPLNSVLYALLYLLLSWFIPLHIHRILFQRNVTYDRSSEADIWLAVWWLVSPWYGFCSWLGVECRKSANRNTFLFSNLQGLLYEASKLFR